MYRRLVGLLAVVTIVAGLTSGCGGGETTEKIGAAETPGVWLMEARAVFPTFVAAGWIWDDHTVAISQSLDGGETFCSWKGKWTYPEGGERENSDLLIAQVVNSEGGCGKEGGDEVLMVVRMMRDKDPIEEMKYRTGDVDLDAPGVPDTRFYLCSKDMNKTTQECDPGLGGIFGESDFPAALETPSKPAPF